MRATLGAGLLLAATTLVGVAATPAEAVSGCDAPTTTWVGPATEGGSASWEEPTNWTNGVPTADSVVCIPPTGPGPLVDTGTAVADTLTLQGTLTIGTSVELGALEADGGAISGGSTTVNSSLTGSGLTVMDGAALDQWGTAVFGEWDARGARVTVHGDAALATSARIDSLGGMFTIADTGSLTYESVEPGQAMVVGGFANHGEVTVKAGDLLMMGASAEDAQPDQFSTGTFAGEPGSRLWISSTELRTGARIDNADVVDHIAVPAGNTATVSDSTVTSGPTESDLSLAGAGELRVTGNSVVSGRIGGSLTISVPAGQVARIGDAVVQDQARIRVHGELDQVGDVNLEGDGALDIYGTHKATGRGGVVDFSGSDPGVETIHPTGQLLAEPDSGLSVLAPFVNHGTVDSGTGYIYLGPTVESPTSSWCTFRADPAGTLFLGSNVAGDPALALFAADIEGAVDISGQVTAKELDVRGELSTVGDGQLTLENTAYLANGASIAGNVIVRGQLQSDPGPNGTASLRGAEVTDTGDILAISGTLSVRDLAPTTLREDGTLTQGQWRVWEGATLDLPAVTTIDAELMLDGPGASFGEGLANLTRIGPNGMLLTVGVDLAVPGPFRNEGLLVLARGARLDVSGRFRQLPAGTLYTYLDSAGRGQVRAAGQRDLAGKLWIDRDPAYKPPRGTVLSFISSNGREDVGDEFDRVVSPPFGADDGRKFRVDYGRDHVRLRVVGVG